MIVLRIYLGETAEQIGIPPMRYEQQKALVDRFLVDWRGTDFATDYLAWLPTQPEGRVDFVPKRIEKKGYFKTPEEPDMPATSVRAGNFARALFRFVVEGMPIESKPEAQRRLSICETNECGYFDGSVCRHTKCGCFSKIKTFFSTEHCPLGKW